MMGTQEKTLFCFCHWGRNNKVLPDGSASYMGGITSQIIVKTGIKYNDFKTAVFGRLGIDPSDKILQFTVKFDTSQLIQLRDEEDVDALLQFNDGSAHVYASSLGDELNSRLPSSGEEKVEAIVDSDLEPDTIPGSDPPVMYECPDPEFSNFDKLREENSFAVDQIWACYDETDAMPRFYAHIRKVCSPVFKVLFRWLEACPEDQNAAAWIQADMPVGCGKFRLGSSGWSTDRLTFSHQIQCVKDEKGLYCVYPRKGETWALIKDWCIRWSSAPDNHRKFKYEVVEILSDYVGDEGVQVGYLDKVTGFVSLFQRTRLTSVGTYFVKPNELYKFSHRIPSSKMTGTGQVGVPALSFELDPASLPLNPDDIWYPGKVREDNRTATAEPLKSIVSAVPPGTRDKSRISENVTTFLKSGDLNGNHATDGESDKVRRSPQGVNISERKRSLMSSRADDVHSTDIGDNCGKRNRHSSLEEPNSRRPSGCVKVVDSDAELDTIPASNPPYPTSSTVQETFWTECAFCKIRYQYYRSFVNRALRCQKCSKPFIAYDLGSQGAPRRPKRIQPAQQDVPLKSNLNQPLEQKVLPNQGTLKMIAGSTMFPPPQTRS